MSEKFINANYIMSGSITSPDPVITTKKIYGSNTQVSKIVSMTIEPEKRSKS